MRTDVFKDIKLSEYDVFDLMSILDNHIRIKNIEIEQAIKDERAGKETTLFDDYTDFIAALEAEKSKAKKLLKDLQKQTGKIILSEEAIDRM